MTRAIALILLIIVPFVGGNATTNNETTGGTASATQTCDMIAKAEAGDAAAVRKMINAKCSIDVMDSRKKNPLIVAVLNGHTSVVWLLTQAGANANVDYQRTPILYYAIKHGNVEIVRILIEAGADFENKLEPYEQTALHNASSWDHADHADIVKLLIDKKVNTEVLNMWGSTPLQIATAIGFAESVRALVKGGAKINILNPQGKTLLHSTVSYDPADMVLYIPSENLYSQPWDWDTERRKKRSKSGTTDWLTPPKP